MISRFLPFIYKMSPWHFLWIGVLAAELFTFISSLIVSKLFWGEISQKIIIIGFIDALVVSFPVIFITIFFVSKINKETAINEKLIEEIKQRELLEDEREKLLIKLGQAHKMESIGTLATGIAHEINQPLSFIKIVFEATKRDIHNNQCNLEELKEDCDESLTQVGKINTIIDHLRTFARDDAITMSDIDLSNTLDHALILMRKQMRLKDIELKSEIENNLPKIMANSIRLEQVFINLFQNSIDALEKTNNGVITVSIYSEGKNVKVLFSDNGKGVPEELQEKIFEPFFTTKEVGKGTGLGLAIVYGIIKEHKGEISYSGGDTGSKFLISLPLKRKTIDSV